MKHRTSWIGGEAHSADAFDTVFEVAVVMPTILRPGLLRAVRSVFAQDLDGRIQLLIGIDGLCGNPELLDTLRAECPASVTLCILDLGHSSAVKNGGLYSCNFGGALRTILSYMAHSEYVAYLDDDNWFAPDHLSTLRATVENRDWAYSYRVFVNPNTSEPICIDEWESVGPGRGVFNEKAGGFCDPNTIMMNKLKCHLVLPHWSMTPWPEGRGSDRVVFDFLRRGFKMRCSNKASSLYTISETDSLHVHRLKMFESKGIVPALNEAGKTIYIRKENAES